MIPVVINSDSRRYESTLHGETGQTQVLIHHTEIYDSLYGCLLYIRSRAPWFCLVAFRTMTTLNIIRDRSLITGRGRGATKRYWGRGGGVDMSNLTCTKNEGGGERKRVPLYTKPPERTKLLIFYAPPSFGNYGSRLCIDAKIIII